MSNDDVSTLDTITMAALMRALQVMIEAYRSQQPDPAALEALERLVMTEIKSLNTDEFGYADQATGLSEGLLLARSVFRYARNAVRTSRPVGEKSETARKATDPARKAIADHHRPYNL